MGFLKKGLREYINIDVFISPYVCIFIIISRIRPVKKFQPILSWSKVWFYQVKSKLVNSANMAWV